MSWQSEQDKKDAERRAEVEGRVAEQHGRVVLEFDEHNSGYEPNEVRLAPASEDDPERYVIQGWNEGGYNWTSLDLEPALKQIATNKELADWLPTVGIELRLGDEMAKKDTALCELALREAKLREDLRTMHRRAQHAEGAVERFRDALEDAKKKNRALGRDLDAVFVAIGDAVWGGEGSPVNVETAVEDIKELEGRTRVYPPKSRCYMLDQGCPVHGYIHGKEAEELREGLKKLIELAQDDADEMGVPVHAIEDMLDRVDARDSVAWLEASKKKDASVS